MSTEINTIHGQFDERPSLLATCHSIIGPLQAFVYVKHANKVLILNGGGGGGGVGGVVGVGGVGGGGGGGGGGAEIAGV